MLASRSLHDNHSNLFLGDHTEGRGWLENFSRKSFLNIKGKIFYYDQAERLEFTWFSKAILIFIWMDKLVSGSWLSVPLLLLDLLLLLLLLYSNLVFSPQILSKMKKLKQNVTFTFTFTQYYRNLGFSLPISTGMKQLLAEQMNGNQAHRREEVR